MEIVDTLGMKCPRPLILTKQALDALEEGTVCTLVDDAVALSNLQDFALSCGFAVHDERENDAWKVFITKTNEKHLQQTAGSDYVLLITSDKLGKEENAHENMQDYFFQVLQQEKKPNIVIFMNSGIFLNVEGAATEELVLKLEEENVELISCGACLDYYGMKDHLLAGKIGNMFTISEKICKAETFIHLK